MALTTAPERPTQAQRRARSRSALLEAAARGLSRVGYANLVLEQVATDAGYTRGALYHQFSDKEELALAVVGWVEETWNEEVGAALADDLAPADALVAMARAHARYCRRDIARVMMNLAVEFGGRDHPIGREVERVGRRIAERVTRLIAAGRARGQIGPGPRPPLLAAAFLGALDGLMIHLSRKTSADVELAERVARGVLGLPASRGERPGGRSA